jgi:hypothetical protein
MNYVNEIISTFPKRIMNETEIREYLKDNEELIILSSYVKCSLSELSISSFIVERVWTKNGKNEYGGTYNEYWKIYKR